MKLFDRQLKEHRQKIAKNTAKNPNFNELIEIYKPDIIVITGHDSYSLKNNNKYANKT